MLRSHEPPPADINDRTRKNLRWIFSDGVAFSLMVGLGETYIPAFALALGMSEVKAGWVVALPTLLGAVMQLVSPAAVSRLRSHRRWVVLCAFLQASSFLVFVGGALSGRMTDFAVFLVASAYWGTGLATGPAWNTWVGTLIPRQLRAAFFARRNRACQAAVMSGLVLGGFALQYGADRGDVLLVFAGLFLAAGLARGASTWFLWSQTEPHPLPRNHRTVPIPELLRRSWSSGDGRLLVYMLVVQTGVQIAGPFFTPYMLGELRFSYLQYLLLICTAYCAKMVTFPFLGTLARRFGSQRLLYASGLGIIPLSALWIVSDDLAYLLAVQVLGGMVWAGYELATFLLLFERIEESERTSVLTLFNLANAVALVGGALIGGLILKALGQVQESYYVVFGLSGLIRIVSIVFLVRLRRVTFTPSTFSSRTLGVRPNTGSLSAPITTSIGAGGEAEESGLTDRN